MSDLAEGNILEVKGLKKFYPIEKGLFKKVVGNIRAVDNVNFKIKSSETLGLVGESGCGKTTTARAVLRALEPTAGEIYFRTSDNNIVDMAKLNKKQLRKVRCDMQMIFQDPYSSLNPRMPVSEIVGEFLTAHGWNKRDTRKRVAELLELVGLDPKYMNRYPHAFSGGQRQRLGIARALSLNPSLIVADEAVSALDVSVQAQILNLMKDLQDKLGISYLFIAHDLSVVRYICDKVAVMYVGKIVEIAKTDELFVHPKHPYTSGLLEAIPDADPHIEWKATLKGEVADPSKKSRGCVFEPRCKYSKDICKEKEPILKNTDSKTEHKAACHFANELKLKNVVGELSL
ncbi:MAG: ABC transporter ATP-binding protein [Halanaerobiaceae bacterium]